MSNRHDVFSAIADPTRRRLLDLLQDGEHSVGALMPHFDMTIGAISQHLRILLEAGLVTRRKDGRFRYYRAAARDLKIVHDWTVRYGRFWDTRLDRLSDYLDGQDGSP